MKVDIICFDCDSTLSKIEGIDELARHAGLFDEMAALTHAAMNGELPLEAVYERRLALIQPTRASIDELAALYIAEIVDGVRELFARLLAQGKVVHIISGGLRPAILPLAAQLNIPAERVHAVDIYFHDDGSYRGFETNSPLARNGGKAEVIADLRGQQSIAMIGDGNTDMEAGQAGAYTIGFGGVVQRAMVRELADAYTAEPTLLAVLPFLTS